MEINFKKYLHENAQSLNESFKNLFKPNEKEKYKEEVFTMLQNAYSKIGGMKGSGFNSPDDMVKNIPFWKLSIKNGVILAGVMYKDKEGRKRVASFTNNTEEGKHKLADIMKNDLNRAFMEVSESSLGFIRKIVSDEELIKYAVKPEKAKALLKETDEDFKFDVPKDDAHIVKAPKLKDYFYQRKIGGSFKTKIMLGKHGNKIITESFEDEEFLDDYDLIDEERELFSPKLFNYFFNNP